jgi:hypothetical protein
MKLKELLDNEYKIISPEEIKTSEDELDNYNKKAEPQEEEKPQGDINMPNDIGENKMGIKLSKLMEGESKRLSTSEMKEVLESVKRFNEYGSKIYRTNEINDMVESIKNVCENAGRLAIQETADWFDVVTVKNDVKGLSGAVDSFSKTAKEISTLQQRLESVYEDIGHKLGKYYEIAEAMDPVGKEDGDIDNDGDEDESDEYLAKKRAAITQAVKGEGKKAYKKDDDEAEGMNEVFSGFRGLSTGRPSSGKVRYDGWKRITEEPVKEAAPKMRKNPEAENIDKIYKAAYLAKKGGGSGRYGKEFEKAKKIALKALADMHQYAKIGG